MRVELSNDKENVIETMHKGTYWNRKFRKTVLPNLQRGRTSILEVHSVTAILREQGFSLNPIRDNKSVYDPGELFDKLANYGTTRSWNPEWDAFDLAWKVTEEMFSKPEFEEFLSPLSLTEVEPETKKNKSSGAPVFVKKGDDVERSLLEAKGIIDGTKKADPCVSYHRIQHGKDGPKLRLVWGFPFAQTLVEGTIALPLIRNFLSRRTAMVFGSTKMGIAARIAKICNKPYQYGFDFSQFDASICPKLIGRAFSILKSWFESSPIVDKLFTLVEKYFIFTPIVMPDGEIYVKSRGVPSGSWFTQLVDSIISYFAMQYCMIVVKHHPVNKGLLCVLGDDSLVGTTYRISPYAIASAANTIGLTINPEKTSFSKGGEDPHFLGHTWKYGLPHRDPYELAIRMAFPEHWINIPKGIDYGESRIVAYISDCIEAWTILRLAPFASRLSPFSIALMLNPSLQVTGWQLYMHSIYGDELVSAPCNPSYFYIGACA